jgi:hypothetical protein
VVFSDLHALVGTLPTRVVRKLADWLSNPPGNERRFDGSAGADDDGAPLGGTWRAFSVTPHSKTFTATFMLLSLTHILLLAVALRLPFFIEKTKQSPSDED